MAAGIVAHPEKCGHSCGVLVGKVAPCGTKVYQSPRQPLLPIVLEPPRQSPAQAIHRLALHLLCPALAEMEMERRTDQWMLDSIGKPIAVQQIGLLSGSQPAQHRIQFCQLFFMDIDLLRRLDVRVGYGFDPQHPFIL